MQAEKKHAGDARARMALALADMLKRTPIDQIVIKELCRRANVNRSTFYRYYDNQYALLSQMWCDLAEVYLRDVYRPGLSTHEALVRLLEFAQENRVVELAIFRLVILGYPLPNCGDFVRTTLVDRCPSEKTDYLQCMLVSIIYNWLIKKNPEPAAFTAQLMMDVAAGMCQA